MLFKPSFMQHHQLVQNFFWGQQAHVLDAMSHSSLTKETERHSRTVGTSASYPNIPGSNLGPDTSNPD
jgi:hypothetical protein